MQPLSDVMRLEHQPSGFAAEYDIWANWRLSTFDFCQALAAHLVRTEAEAFDPYQEPHMVRL